MKLQQLFESRYFKQQSTSDGIKLYNSFKPIVKDYFERNGLRVEISVDWDEDDYKYVYMAVYFYVGGLSENQAASEIRECAQRYKIPYNRISTGESGKYSVGVLELEIHV